MHCAELWEKYVSWQKFVSHLPKKTKIHLLREKWKQPSDFTFSMQCATDWCLVGPRKCSLDSWKVSRSRLAEALNERFLNVTAVFAQNDNGQAGKHSKI